MRPKGPNEIAPTKHKPDWTTFLVAMSEGKHPFPFRTRQLSPQEPMVLRGPPRGRVGRRQDSSEGPPGPIPGGPSRFLTAARGLAAVGAFPYNLPG